MGRELIGTGNPCIGPTILLDKLWKEAEVIKKDSLDWRVVV